MSACYVILVHVTWAFAWEWALLIRAAKAVTCMDAYVGVGAFPGHYGNRVPAREPPYS